MSRWILALALAGAVALTALAVWSAGRVSHIDVAILARRAPYPTALMRQRAAEAARAGHAYSIDTRWIPYDRVSPLLRRAVLIAEDDAFYQHGGLDWNELRESTRKNLEAHRVVRGGSTITQQLAKNLYLSSQRTVVRKLEEVFLALRMERALSKRRIFELYLNRIEWGDGIFGCEAAAQRLFGVSAANLDPRQALLLAAIIINPRRFSALEPSRRIERRVRMIASRMRRRGFLDASQYAIALGLPPPPAAPGETLAPAMPADTAPSPDSVVRADTTAQP